jgi:hypothetical protein
MHGKRQLSAQIFLRASEFGWDRPAVEGRRARRNGMFTVVPLGIDSVCDYSLRGTLRKRISLWNSD